MKTAHEIGAYSEAYIPGVCNIGPAEVARRRLTGWIAAALAVLLFLYLGLSHSVSFWRIVLFLPLFAVAISFFQTTLHFCVGFGMSGIYNVLKPVGKTEKIEQAEYRKADKAKAGLIMLYSVVTALVLTALAYYLLSA